MITGGNRTVIYGLDGPLGAMVQSVLGQSGRPVPTYLLQGECVGHGDVQQKLDHIVTGDLVVAGVVRRDGDGECRRHRHMEQKRDHIIPIDQAVAVNVAGSPESAADGAFLAVSGQCVFGNIVLFRLPEGEAVPFGHTSGAYGEVADELTAAAVCLRKGIFLMGEKVCFRT